MKKTIIFSLISFGLGTITGILISRKYYEKKSDAEIEDMEVYYQNQLEECGLRAVRDYGIGEGNEEVNPEKPNLSEIREKLQRNHEVTTNYAEMYRQKAMEAPDAQNEEEYEDEDRYEGSESEAANEEYAQNRGRRPRIISYEEAANLLAHTGNETLYYYTYSESLVDEHDNEIDEPGLLLGDCLEKYDFVHSNERIIFVMNYDLDICYEVQKVDSEWNPDE